MGETIRRQWTADLVTIDDRVAPGVHAIRSNTPIPTEPIDYLIGAWDEEDTSGCQDTGTYWGTTVSAYGIDDSAPNIENRPVDGDVTHDRRSCSRLHG